MTLATEQDAFAVENTVKKAIKEVAPKFDEVQSVDVLFVEGGRWHTIEVTWHEYLAMLQNGSYIDGTETVQACSNLCQ
jgi:hypothetical protein